MNVKKIMTGALALAMAASVLTITGCKKDSKVDADGNVILDWYTMKLVDNTSSEEAVENAVNEMIHAKGIKASIDLHLIEKGSYYEKMNTMILGGEEFDICFQSDASKFVSNVKKDAFVELTDDMLNEYAPDIVETLKDTEWVWKASMVDGKIYGVKSEGAYSKKVGTVFKKDLVEKYGFDYKSVDSIADLEPYLETIKQNEPGITPLLPTVTEVSAQFADDSVKGLIFNEESGKYEKYFNTDFFINRYRTLNDYYNKGYIAKDAAQKTETTVEAKSGKYAVMGDSGFYTEDGSKSSAQYGFPCVDAYMGQTIVNPKGGAMNCISSTSEYPELALEVLNLIWADDEISNTLAYGIEGVNYEINEERTAELGEKAITPATGTDVTWTFYHNYVGPLFDQWDSSWNTKESLEMMQEANVTAPVSKTIGFTFNSDPVQSEYVKITAIYTECEPVFKNGCMEDFDLYLADVQNRLDEAGLDKVLEEANRQYQEFLSNK